MHICKGLRESKLKRLLDAEGYPSIEDMFRAVLFEASSPAICVEPDCDHICEMELDQDEGYCDECLRNTMVVAPVLAGLIWRTAFSDAVERAQENPRREPPG